MDSNGSNEAQAEGRLGREEIEALVRTAIQELRHADSGWPRLALKSKRDDGAILTPEQRQKANEFYSVAFKDLRTFCYQTLHRGAVELLDPFSGLTFTTDRSLFCGRRSFFPAIVASELILVATIGHRPTTLYYLRRKIIVELRAYKDAHSAAIGDFMQAVQADWPGFLDYMLNAGARPTSTGLLIGEDRPTHFFREMIPALLWLHDSKRLSKLLQRIDLFIEVRDWTFIEMENVLPSILPRYSYKKLSADRAAVLDVTYKNNLFVFGFLRVDEYVTDHYLEVIRDAALGRVNFYGTASAGGIASKNGTLMVSFSVDAEKSRFKNQREIFKLYLEELHKLRGTKFVLLVDGWTPKRSAVNSSLGLSSKDKLVISQIEKFVASVFSQMGWRPERVIPAYRMNYLDKIALYSDVAFFVSTQGTAALLPSLIWRRNGVTYHNPEAIDVDTEVYLPTLRKVPKAGLRFADAKGKVKGTRPSRVVFKVNGEVFQQVLAPYLQETLEPAAVAAAP